VTTKHTQLLNILMYCLIIAVVVLMLASIREINQVFSVPAVPISIAEATIVAHNPNVCPGDMLNWPLTITYNKAPLLMDVTRNVRNLDTGTLVVSYVSQLSIPQEETGTFKRNILWSVPDLPPAKYRLITTTTSVVGSELLQYYVEFTVLGNC